MRGVSFGLLWLCSALLPAAAWDPFGIFNSAKERAEEAGDHLIGNAKAAFEAAMADLFDNKIGPMIDKVNAMVLEDAEAIKKDVEEVIATTEKAIDDMIDHAAAVAQQLIDHEIEEIKEKIIDETAAKVEECEDHFFQGVNNVLQQFYAAVVKINCMAQGDIDRVYEDVYKLIGSGCLLPDTCCFQQGVQFKTLKNMGDSQLYGLDVCRRTSGLSPSTPVSDLIKAYMDCQIIAKKFYCIDFGTGSARDFFTKEYNRWGVEYELWNHPVHRIERLQRDHSAISMPRQPQPLHKSVSLGSSDDPPPCATPVECYQLAIQKLNEARQEITNKADISVVQPLLDMQAQQLTLFHGEQCPPGWVESKLTSGYMLVGRPTGGKVGTQLNTPLTAGEAGRVGPHGHNVADPGHNHGVHDPGHTHASGMKGGTSGGVGSDHDQQGAIDYDINTLAATTGISLAASGTGVSVPVANVLGVGVADYYPQSYVLICEKSSLAVQDEAPVMV